MAMRAGVPLFMLIGRYPIRCWPRTSSTHCPGSSAFLSAPPRPFIARIYKASDADFAAGKPGRVNLWLSYDDWRRLNTATPS